MATPQDLEKDDPLKKANQLLATSAKVESVRKEQHKSWWNEWRSRNGQSITQEEENKTKSGPVDPLLERVYKTQEAARRLAKVAKKRRESSTAYQAHKQAKDVIVGFGHAAQVGLWIYKNILQPVASVLGPVGSWMWDAYMKLWNRAVYTKNAEGEWEFGKKRAVAMT